MEQKEMPEEEVGKVSNYFSRIGVAAIEITNGYLRRGDVIRIKGTKTDFTQNIDSMEIDRKPIEKAEKGASVGIKVKDKVRPGDTVYKIT
jgi:putative protease